jgi:protein-L-isoaspartate(D-aspartate) O-methyltransferase
VTERRPVDDLVDEVAEEVQDPRVLEAIRAIPRERFVQEHLRRYAYEDSPLPIGRGQTISQPTIVGMMTEALALTGDERVLEIGTGSGYQAAVLARLCRELVTVEVIDELREGAERVLHALGITNVRVLRATDDLGAPSFGPYDAIIVTAAAPSVPAPLLEQLAVGGRLVIPVGTREEQRLVLVTRTTDGTTTRNLGACRFVPLVGPHGFND